MTKKKTLIPVILAFALGATIAPESFAADLGYKDIPAAAVQNWSGFYAGVSAGAVNNNDRTDYSYSYLPGNSTNNFSDFFGSAADNVHGFGVAGPLNIPGLNAVQSAQAEGFLPAFLGSGDANGFIGGAHLGYNWQSGPLVFGVETSISFVDQSSSHQFSETIPNAYTNAGRSSTSVDWLGTTAFRLGYAIDGRRRTERGRERRGHRLDHLPQHEKIVDEMLVRRVLQMPRQHFRIEQVPVRLGPDARADLRPRDDQRLGAEDAVGFPERGARHRKARAHLRGVRQERSGRIDSGHDFLPEPRRDLAVDVARERGIVVAAVSRHAAEQRAPGRRAVADQCACRWFDDAPHGFWRLRLSRPIATSRRLSAAAR